MQPYTFSVSSTTATRQSDNILWVYSSWLGLGCGTGGNTWYHSLETTTSNASIAAYEQKGLQTKAIFSYLSGASSNVTVPLTASCSTNISYINAYGNAIYYNMSSYAYGSMIVVPANNPY